MDESVVSLDYQVGDTKRSTLRFERMLVLRPGTCQIIDGSAG